MQLFNRPVSTRGLAVFGFETVLVAGSMLLAAHVHGASIDLQAAIGKIVAITVIWELCFYYNGLYDLTLVNSKPELLIRVVQAAGAAAIAVALVSILVPSMVVGIGAGVMITAIGVLLITVPVWRLAFESLAGEVNLDEPVLVLGTNAIARTVAREILAQRDFAYRLVGFVDDGVPEPGAVEARVLGKSSDLPELIRRHQVKRIVVSLIDRRGRLPTRHLLQAKLSGVRVEDAATTYERLTGKILTDGITPSWLIFSDDFRASWLTRAVKRGLDVILVLLGMIATTPLAILIALAIALDSPGGVLYRQERVGENGRVFTLFKFRSMRAGAECGTPVWARDRDERVTRVGRVLRTLRLDELPQLWNVLTGDMSFVGPRPERPFFVTQLAAAIPFYMERHAVRPGVTGWAQVRYRYGASLEDAVEKLRYDLYYIKHLSIGFDLAIVLDTIKVILSGRGAK